MDAKPTELGNVHVLPNCLAREPRGLIESKCLQHRPVFCANCGCQSPYYASETIPYAFWLCEDRTGQRDCSAKWQHLVGLLPIPDEVFFELVKQASIEHDGRELTAAEQAEALKSSDHYLSKLARGPRAVRALGVVSAGTRSVLSPWQILAQSENRPCQPCTTSHNPRTAAIRGRSPNYRCDSAGNGPLPRGLTEWWFNSSTYQR